MKLLPTLIITWQDTITFPWDEIIVNCVDREDRTVVDFDFVYKEKTYYCYFYTTDVTARRILRWLEAPYNFSIDTKITDVPFIPDMPYSQVIRCKTFQEVQVFLEVLTMVDKL